MVAIISIDKDERFYDKYYDVSKTGPRIVRVNVKSFGTEGKYYYLALYKHYEGEKSGYYRQQNVAMTADECGKLREVLNMLHAKGELMGASQGNQSHEPVKRLHESDDDSDTKNIKQEAAESSQIVDQKEQTTESNKTNEMENETIEGNQYAGGSQDAGSSLFGDESDFNVSDH